MHGALLDSKILALVYLELTGGQTDFFDRILQVNRDEESSLDNALASLHGSPYIIQPTEDEIAQHEEMVEFIAQKSGIKRFAFRSA